MEEFNSLTFLISQHTLDWFYGWPEEVKNRNIKLISDTFKQRLQTNQEENGVDVLGFAWIRIFDETLREFKFKDWSMEGL